MAELYDRHPLEFEGRWLWHPAPDDAGLDEQPDYLPRDIFDRLAGYIEKPPHVTRRVKAYPTREAANFALDDARRPE
jgi:hypothetical protein